MLKAASVAETRGWQASEKNDADSLQVLQSNGMTIAQPSEALRKELKRIGETMTSEWLVPLLVLTARQLLTPIGSSALPSGEPRTIGAGSPRADTSTCGNRMIAVDAAEQRS